MYIIIIIIVIIILYSIVVLLLYGFLTWQGDPDNLSYHT